eukprot:2741462-Amphidinium_carterae.5
MQVKQRHRVDTLPRSTLRLAISEHASQWEALGPAQQAHYEALAACDLQRSAEMTWPRKLLTSSSTWRGHKCCERGRSECGGANSGRCQYLRGDPIPTGYENRRGVARVGGRTGKRCRDGGGVGRAIFQAERPWGGMVDATCRANRERLQKRRQEGQHGAHVRIAFWSTTIGNI